MARRGVELGTCPRGAIDVALRGQLDFDLDIIAVKGCLWSCMWSCMGDRRSVRIDVNISAGYSGEPCRDDEGERAKKRKAMGCLVHSGRCMVCHTATTC